MRAGCPAHFLTGFFPDKRNLLPVRIPRGCMIKFTEGDQGDARAKCHGKGRKRGQDSRPGAPGSGGTVTSRRAPGTVPGRNGGAFPEMVASGGKNVRPYGSGSCSPASTILPADGRDSSSRFAHFPPGRRSPGPAALRESPAAFPVAQKQGCPFEDRAGRRDSGTGFAEFETPFRTIPEGDPTDPGPDGKSVAQER